MDAIKSQDQGWQRCEGVAIMEVVEVEEMSMAGEAFNNFNGRGVLQVQAGVEVVAIM